jgi:hypothetical protein
MALPPASSLPFSFIFFLFLPTINICLDWHQLDLADGPVHLSILPMPVSIQLEDAMRTLGRLNGFTNIEATARRTRRTLKSEFIERKMNGGGNEPHGHGWHWH